MREFVPEPVAPKRRDITFVAIKTSGRNASVHEILDLAVIRVDGETLEELDKERWLITPHRIAEANPKALRASLFDVEMWAALGKPIDVVVDQVRPLLDGAVLAGHDIASTLAFLRRAFHQADVRYGFLFGLTIDTAALAWPLYQSGRAADMTFRPVCSCMGVTTDWRQSAMDDALDTLKLTRRFAGIYSVALDIALGKEA